MTTTSVILILIAYLLGIFWVGLAKILGGKYNNFQPRKYLSKLEGIPQRALWTHQNGHEVLPLFMAAIIIANMNSVADSTIIQWGGAFILSRVAYGLCYIFNQAILRSLVWAVGIACCFILMFQ